MNLSKSLRASLAILLSLSVSTKVQSQAISGGGDNDGSIIGGTPSPRVRGYVASGPGACGGQLIHPDIVLTAAHCLGANNEDAFFPGTTLFISATTFDNAVETRTVAKWVPHENFVLEENNPCPTNEEPNRMCLSLFLNDIAIVVLNQVSAEPTATFSRDPSKPSAGDTVRVMGFGRTVTQNGLETSPVLLETTLTILSDDDPFCTGGVFVSAQNSCAADASNPRTTTTCNGDSGSPYFDTVTNEVVGVVSFGPSGCGPNDGASAMTQVSSYYTWVQEKICKESKNPPNTCFEPAAKCGDNICTAGIETLANCPQDCADCGDGVCTANVETLANCPQDCANCGDGTCTPNVETEATCATDCALPAPAFSIFDIILALIAGAIASIAAFFLGGWLDPFEDEDADETADEMIDETLGGRAMLLF